MKKKNIGIITGIFVFIILVGIIGLIFLNKTHFKIYKEECEEKPSFIFNQKGQQMIISPQGGDLGKKQVFTFNDFNSNRIFVEYEVCEQVEVDEMIVCCLEDKINLEPNKFNDSGNTIIGQELNYSICMPEENMKYFEVPCESLKKEDLTIEWLDLNAECTEVYSKTSKDYLICSYDGTSCDSMIDNRFYFCSKYKFGEYTIDTWEQLI